MEEYIESFGALPSPPDPRDYKGIAACAVEFPDEFELKMCKVKNQGSVGSCVAHSMSEIIEYFNNIQEGSYSEMSVGYLYGNRDLTLHKGAGYYVRDMLKVASKFGDVPYELFPYNLEVPDMTNKFNNRDKSIDKEAYPNRITEYYSLSDEASMKSHLMNNGPIIFMIEWFNSYKIKNNKLVFTSNLSQGYHCMVIYGWNKDGWKFMNSWGKNFGNNGCAILPYEHNIPEAWGVIDTNINNGNKGVNIVKPNKVKVYLYNAIKYIKSNIPILCKR